MPEIMQVTDIDYEIFSLPKKEDLSAKIVKKINDEKINFEMKYNDLLFLKLLAL